MDFRETGLPYDPVVYKAFMTYMQAVSGLEKTAYRQERHFSLLTARVLHEAKINDPELLSAAILAALPPQTWGEIQRRMGQGVADLLREAEKQQLSDFEHLKHASDKMKLLALASGLASFEEFKGLTENFDAGMGGIEPGAKGGEIPLPLFNNIPVFQRILGAVTRGTSSPELEDLYAEKLEEARRLQQEQIVKLREMGGALPPALQEGAMMNYPPFEKTGLMNHKKVREAYAIITSHMNVLPLDFQAAVQVGRLLGASPETQDAATIAAALLDISFRDISNDDKDMLQGKMDWDVMEIIYDRSVYAIGSARDLQTASVEFRRIALANAVVVTEEALQTGRDILELIRLDQRMPLEEKQEMLGSIRTVMLYSAELYLPLRAEAPDLERAYEEGLARLRKFVEKNPPPSVPRPPFPRKPKDGFSP